MSMSRVVHATRERWARDAAEETGEGRNLWERGDWRDEPARER